MVAWRDIITTVAQNLTISRASHSTHDGHGLLRPQAVPTKLHLMTIRVTPSKPPLPFPRLLACSCLCADDQHLTQPRGKQATAHNCCMCALHRDAMTLHSTWRSALRGMGSESLGSLGVLRVAQGCDGKKWSRAFLNGATQRILHASRAARSRERERPRRHGTIITMSAGAKSAVEGLQHLEMGWTAELCHKKVGLRRYGLHNAPKSGYA